MADKYALIVGNFPASREDVRSQLAQAGCGYVPVWEGTEEADRVQAEVEVVITAEHVVTAAEIDALPNVKMLSLAFTGYDHVDLNHCRKKGLFVYYVPDYSKPSVAELVVLLTLALFRKLRQADANTRTGRFDGGGVQPGIELEGSTVAIIGTGKIGTHTARKFLGLGCRVVGWNRSERPEFTRLGSEFAKLGPEYEGRLSYSSDLAEVLTHADVVSLHLATNEETIGFADAGFFSQMATASILINTARGGLVNTGDLVAVLESGHIAGAGIDVYDEEPVPTKDACESAALRRLLDLDQVVLTPHLGFKTDRSLARLASETIENVVRYVARVRDDATYPGDVRQNSLVEPRKTSGASKHESLQ